MEVGVLGATDAGQAIVSRCLDAGHDVHLYDEDANEVMDAIDAVERRTDGSGADAVDGTTGLEAAVGGAEVVVDATAGETAERRELLAAAEEFFAGDPVVATSGGSVSVTAVAAGLRRPDRALGLHFVPGSDGAVVEVVVADQTAADALDRGLAFVEGLGGTGLVVRDAPGFASARLDLAQIAEAIRLVEEEVASVEDVDRALELGRDHPTGPLALADQLGLDRVLAALEDLTDRLSGRFAPPGLLREKVEAGELGVTTGRGFYVWEDGDRTEPAGPDPQIEARSEVPEDPVDPGER